MSVISKKTKAVPNDLARWTSKDILRGMWPQYKLYKEQWEVVDSVDTNYETFCVAGNMLGKDFLSGFVVTKAALVNDVFRIVTTSVKDEHLNVLWGEINRFIDTCRFDLHAKKGGPFVVNHHQVRKIDKATGILDPISYVRGMVSEKAEGLAGHHAPYTLGVVDEASGVADIAYTQMMTWCKHFLAIGNPNRCENWFKKGVMGGDVIDDSDSVPVISPGG